MLFVLIDRVFFLFQVKFKITKQVISPTTEGFDWPCFFLWINWWFFRTHPGVGKFAILFDIGMFRCINIWIRNNCFHLSFVSVPDSFHLRLVIFLPSLAVDPRVLLKHCIILSLFNFVASSLKQFASVSAIPRNEIRKVNLSTQKKDELHDKLFVVPTPITFVVTGPQM